MEIADARIRKGGEDGAKTEIFALYLIIWLLYSKMAKCGIGAPPKQPVLAYLLSGSPKINDHMDQMRSPLA